MMVTSRAQAARSHHLSPTTRLGLRADSAWIGADYGPQNERADVDDAATRVACVTTGSGVVPKAVRSSLGLSQRHIERKTNCPACAGICLRENKKGCQILGNVAPATWHQTSPKCNSSQVDVARTCTD